MDRSKFQTIVDIPEYKNKTGYKNQNLFIGSCFTENIGNKLMELKFNTLVNPFGILYNPASIENGLRLLLNPSDLKINDLFEFNGLWHSFYHHGQFSGPDKNEMFHRIQARMVEAAQILLQADFLFLTFGTAWVYQEIRNGTVVANCHKLPEKNFLRTKLRVDEIVSAYNLLISQLEKINPKLKIVFTVSPIRHWKDGAIENQRSKATLLLAIDEIIQKHKNTVTYFPAYEIVMDELRDYRYYADDMIHISDFAISHIWEIFNQHLIDEESQLIEKEVLKILKARQHIPFYKNSKEYLKFIKNIKTKTEILETKFPNINLKLEKEYFQVELNKIKSFMNKNSC